MSKGPQINYSFPLLKVVSPRFSLILPSPPTHLPTSPLLPSIAMCIHNRYQICFSSYKNLI